LTSLSRHGRCDSCRREFEFQPTGSSGNYKVVYRYQLGAMQMSLELECADDAALHIICPTCLRRAVSEAEFVE